MTLRPAVSRVLAVAWTLLILVLVSIPGETLPSVSLLEFDKVAHAGMFAGFAFLWMDALPSRMSWRLAWVSGIGVAYGVLTEVYQGVMPFGRSADPLDAVANVTGIFLGIGLYSLVVYWRARSAGSGTATK